MEPNYSKKNLKTNNNYSGEKTMNQNCNKRKLKYVLALVSVLFFLPLQPKLLAFTLDVQDSSGNPVKHKGRGR